MYIVTLNEVSFTLEIRWKRGTGVHQMPTLIQASQQLTKFGFALLKFISFGTYNPVWQQFLALEIPNWQLSLTNTRTRIYSLVYVQNVLLFEWKSNYYQRIQIRDDDVMMKRHKFAIDLPRPYKFVKLYFSLLFSQILYWWWQFYIKHTII